MRISLAHNQRCADGNVLVVSLVISGFLGFVLAGYLTLVAGQNNATMRSLAWGSAMPIAEAGIEEAMTQINANGTNLVANNNWTLVDGNYFLKWLTVGEDRYLAGFFNSVPPVLVSQGFTRLPLGTNMISRTVVVRTRLARLFTKGMVGLEKINLNGNDINVDSFDSVDPNYSTGGRYDFAKKKDNGAIATNSALTNSFDGGNANIRGRIATGPGGVPRLGSNSSVGSNSWVDAGNVDNGFLGAPNRN